MAYYRFKNPQDVRDMFDATKWQSVEAFELATKIEHRTLEAWLSGKPGQRAKGRQILAAIEVPAAERDAFLEEAVAEGEEVVITPPDPVVPFSLPPDRVVCVGRDELRDELVPLVLAYRPVRLYGSGGIGKTTLAHYLLRHEEVLQKFGKRMAEARCDTSNATDAEGVLRAVALALNVSLSLTNLMGGVQARLDEGPTTLLIDNLETALDGDTEAVGNLLTRLTRPTTALIVTMRDKDQPAFLDWGDQIEVPALPPLAAIEAFVSIAGKAKVPEDDPLLPPLLKDLSYVPLAIELMAAQMLYYPDLKVLVKEWETEKVELLRRGSGTGHTESIEASVEFSLRRPKMTRAALEFLKRLALLPSGVAIADSERVLPGEGPKAVRLLRSLSLVIDEANGTRIQLLNPVRQYIAKQYPLEESEHQALCKRYLQWASTFWNDISNRRVEQISPEAATMDEMLRYGLKHLPRTALHSLTALANFIRQTDRMDQNLFTLGLEAACNESRWWEKPWYEAHCILHLGLIALQRSQLDEAKRQMQEAIPLYRSAEDSQGEAHCILNLGEIALRRSQLDEAEQQMQKSLHLCQSAGDPMGEANCIVNLGKIALQRFQLDEAKRRMQEAIPLYQKVESTLGEAHSIFYLGVIALQRSQLDEAEQRMQEAIPLYQSAGVLRAEANCTQGFGHIEAKRGNGIAAEKFAQVALSLHQKAEDNWGIAECYCLLSEARLLQGDFSGAREHGDESLRIYIEIGHRYGPALTYHTLARIPGKEAERAAFREKAREFMTGIWTQERIEEWIAETGE